MRGTRQERERAGSGSKLWMFPAAVGLVLIGMIVYLAWPAGRQEAPKVEADLDTRTVAIWETVLKELMRDREARKFSIPQVDYNGLVEWIAREEQRIEILCRPHRIGHGQFVAICRAIAFTRSFYQAIERERTALDRRPPAPPLPRVPVATERPVLPPAPRVDAEERFKQLRAREKRNVEFYDANRQRIEAVLGEYGL